MPERRAFLEKRPDVLKKAKTAYPFLQNPNHKGAKYAAELVQRTGLAHRADYELIAGDAYIGVLVRTGAANVVRDSSHRTGNATGENPRRHSAAAGGEQGCCKTGGDSAEWHAGGSGGHGFQGHPLTFQGVHLSQEDGKSSRRRDMERRQDPRRVE